MDVAGHCYVPLDVAGEGRKAKAERNRISRRNVFILRPVVAATPFLHNIDEHHVDLGDIVAVSSGDGTGQWRKKYMTASKLFFWEHFLVKGTLRLG